MNLALRLIQLLLRHRLIAGVLLLLSVGASLYAARTIEVRFQYKDFYQYEGNPRLPLLNRHTEEFGDPGGFVVLLIESPDVFSNEVLSYVDTVTRRLESLDEFRQVRSLTNARAIRAAGEDELETGQLLRRLPLSAEEAARAREVALSSALLVRRLVAPDGAATAVLAEMRTPTASATIPEQQAAVTAVTRVMQSTPSPAGARIQVTGAPMVEVETTKALLQDQLQLTPAVLLILIVALALTFRSAHGILLPLAAVTVSLVWTAGIFSFLGRPVDIVGSTIPTVLLVYGVVDPIFVYTRFTDKLAVSRTREHAVMETMRELLLPCFLTSLTTALGFAAFATAALPMIKYFGIVVGVGVLLAFVTTVTVLPLLLVSVEPHLPAHKPWISRVTDTLMHWIWDVAKARPELTVAIALSVLILGGGAASQMRIVNEYVGVLPQGRVQNSVRLLEQKLSGVVRAVVYLEGDMDSMRKPEVLQAIEAVDRFAEQQPIVTSSLSLADLVGDTNRAFLSGDPKEQRVPDSESLISQYLSLVDPGDLSDFVNRDFSHSHIRILLSDRGSESVLQLRDVLQREIDARFPQLGVQATVTGSGVVSYYASDDVVVEVLWGFLVAFSVIILVQLTIFRSLRAALLSIIPNVVPVGVCFLVMHALGLNLRVDNSLVLCVSVGGLFNTTIHIVTRIMRQVRTGNDEPDVIVGNALAAVGPPSLYTAVILSLGFSAMGLSHFPGLQVLGLLCLVTLMSGFVADAMLTTTFFKLFFNWKTARAAAQARAVARLDSLAMAEKESLP